MTSPLPRVTARPASTHGDSSIGALLLEAGKITPESAERVLRMQKEQGSVEILFVVMVFPYN